MPDLIDLELFRTEAKAGRTPTGGVMRFTLTEPVEVEGESRTLRWVFSDGSVDRMTDTIDPKGWELDRYKANPVILWAHDASAPPIGLAANVSSDGTKLAGDVTFAEADVYEFADTIFRLVKGKFIRAGSVGFLPLEWKWTKDKARPNGIDFKRQELMEFSICPIPANPNALNEARSAGIDTRPLIGWAEKILDGGDSILIPRAELDAIRKAAEPRSVKRYSVGAVTKDLDNVSWLASLLQSLSALEGWVKWETEIEGDDSPIAGRLTAVLQILGQILVDMTAEEVAELLDHTDADDDMGGVLMAAHTPGQKAISALARMAFRGDIAKAGRVLSSKNEADIQQARDLIDGVLTQVVSVPVEDDADATEKAATRLRKAKALQRRLALAA